MILHITHKQAWQDALSTGEYRGDTLTTDGFIHCSKPEQVVAVANHIFKGVADLLLLVIDENKIDAEVKYEDGGEGELYPHIYGALNTDAVIDTISFPYQEDGVFKLPSKIAHTQ